MGAPGVRQGRILRAARSMTISFRTRVFAVAGMVVATVLTAVGLIVWDRILGNEIARLDPRLCMEARRLAMQPGLDDDLARLQTDISNKFRLKSVEQQMLMRIPSPGEAEGESSWPPGLEIDPARWAPLAGFEPPPPKKAPPDKGGARICEEGRTASAGCAMPDRSF